LIKRQGHNSSFLLFALMIAAGRNWRVLTDLRQSKSKKDVVTNEGKNNPAAAGLRSITNRVRHGAGILAG
jgi:hypothetical protein